MTKCNTLQDVVDWAIEHKRGNVFKDFSDKDIEQTIIEAYQKGNILVDVNNCNELFGLVIYTPYLYIDHILTTHKYSFKNLVTVLYKKFPRHNGYATRRGKTVRYISEKIIKKL